MMTGMVRAGLGKAFACLLAGSGALQGCQPEVAAVVPGPENDELAGSSYAATVQRTPGLLAYFRFSEPSGTVALDRVGGYSLETVNPAVLGGEGAVPGDPEKGEARFDGDAGSRFSMPFPEAFGLRSRELTLELWLRLASCRQPSSPLAKLLWVQGIAGAFWGLGVTGDNSDALTFQVQIDVEAYELFDAVTPDGTLRAPTQTDCTGESWQHLVSTVDLNAQADHLKVYVDGQLAAVNGDLHPRTIEELSVESAVAGLEIDPHLEVGASAPSEDDGVATSGEPFLGSLDELAVYSRALDATEIEEHYAAASPESARR